MATSHHIANGYSRLSNFGHGQLTVMMMMVVVVMVKVVSFLTLATDDGRLPMLLSAMFHHDPDSRSIPTVPFGSFPPNKCLMMNSIESSVAAVQVTGPQLM